MNDSTYPIGFDALKHLVLCRLDHRSPQLDLAQYPHLPAPRVTTTAAAYRHHVWASDFLTARTHDGRPLKILVVVDEYSRECLAIRVVRRLRSTEVLETLAELFVTSLIGSKAETTLPRLFVRIERCSTPTRSRMARNLKTSSEGETEDQLFERARMPRPNVITSQIGDVPVAVEI